MNENAAYVVAVVGSVPFAIWAYYILNRGEYYRGMKGFWRWLCENVFLTKNKGED